jgi:predicted outer membrane repeat protein
MFAGSAPTLIQNCLFRSNCSKNGNGAGLFSQKGSMTIDASVFDGNNANANAVSMGGAIYVSKTIATITNSVFTRNTSKGDGGAIWADGSAFGITNCTFYANTSLTGAGGISGTGSNYNICNTILWHDIGASPGCINGSPCYMEFGGNGFTVTYSCLTTAFIGAGNINTDPVFVYPSMPSGNDFTYGTLDDGLMLQNSSPCVASGTTAGFPNVDILGFNRPALQPCDRGAYFFQASNNNVLGKYNDFGTFVPMSPFTVLNNLKSDFGVLLSLQKGYHRLIQIELPKNEYTDKKNTVVVQVSTVKADNSPIGNPVAVTLYRINSSSQIFRSHYWNSGALVGKPILFTNNSTFIGEKECAYVIQGENLCKAKVSLDKGQFN